MNSASRVAVVGCFGFVPPFPFSFSEIGDRRMTNLITGEGDDDRTIPHRHARSRCSGCSFPFFPFLLFPYVIDERADTRVDFNSGLQGGGLVIFRRSRTRPPQRPKCVSPPPLPPSFFHSRHAKPECRDDDARKSARGVRQRQVC